MIPTSAYLAGPMRGIKEFNFPAFRRATKILRDRGISIISPHELDEAAGYDWAGFTGHEDLAEYKFDLVERLTEDIHAIGEVDAVILLDGWSNSSGASAEASFAWAVGKPVYLFEEGNRTNGFTNSLLRLNRGTIIALEGDYVDEWGGLMAPKLIGLAGYARTGKDTVGAYLAEQYGYERKAFADKLRELASEANPLLWNADYGMHRYNEALDSLGYEGAKNRNPEVRDFLVRLGAGARQVLGQDVWLDALLPLPKSPHTGLMPWGSAVAEAPTVVTDVRYINEAQRIVDLGGEVWYITRPGVGPANAEEARSFDEMLVHGPAVLLIENWGTIEELHHQVDLTLAHARP